MLLGVESVEQEGRILEAIDEYSKFQRLCCEIRWVLDDWSPSTLGDGSSVVRSDGEVELREVAFRRVYEELLPRAFGNGEDWSSEGFDREIYERLETERLLELRGEVLKALDVEANLKGLYDWSVDVANRGFSGELFVDNDRLGRVSLNINDGRFVSYGLKIGRHVREVMSFKVDSFAFKRSLSESLQAIEVRRRYFGEGEVKNFENAVKALVGSFKSDVTMNDVFMQFFLGSRRVVHDFYRRLGSEYRQIRSSRLFDAEIDFPQRSFPREMFDLKRRYFHDRWHGCPLGSSRLFEGYVRSELNAAELLHFAGMGHGLSAGELFRRIETSSEMIYHVLYGMLRFVVSTAEVFDGAGPGDIEISDRHAF